MLTLVIETLSGHCPVQGTGTVNGVQFYFRARGEHWTMDIGEPDPDYEDLVATGGWKYSEEYEPGSVFGAGWMDHDVAAGLIAKAAFRWAFASRGEVMHRTILTPEQVVCVHEAYPLMRALCDSHEALRIKAETAEFWAIRAKDAKARLRTIAAEFDALREDCARVSRELDLPPTITLDDGEFRRMKDLAMAAGAERARAERYLALIKGFVDARAHDGICIPPEVPGNPAFERTEAAEQALRAAVKEEGK